MSDVKNDSDDFYLRISYWYKYRATYILLQPIQFAFEKYSLLILLSLVQDDKLPLQVINLGNLLFSYL